jgi:DNA-binding NarL/FixJ family response regulator
MRVIIIDDHQSFREAFKLAITEMASVSVVGEASTAREAYALIETTQPDLVIVDLSLKDSDGIALAHELKRRRITARIMILTMHSNGLFVREALEAGAQGYAVKEQPLAEIVEAMQTCVRGDRYLSPLVHPVPGSDEQVGTGDNGDSTFLERLSRREREIATHVIRGNSSQSIATFLCISLKTVETHRAHINRKLGVHSTAELIRLAAMKGLLAGQPTTQLAIPAAQVSASNGVS